LNADQLLSEVSGQRIEFDVLTAQARDALS
jgi:hypothetical protein